MVHKKKLCIIFSHDKTLTDRPLSTVARAQRNNTEAFIDKHCTPNDQLYVMREVRKQDASGLNTNFRTELLNSTKKRTDDNRKQQQDTQLKSDLELQRLISVGIVTDRAAIEDMKVTDLQDQLNFYRKVFNDEILIKTFQKSLPLRIHKIFAVLAALTRHEV